MANCDEGGGDDCVGLKSRGCSRFSDRSRISFSLLEGVEGGLLKVDVLPRWHSLGWTSFLEIDFDLRVIVALTTWWVMNIA